MISRPLVKYVLTAAMRDKLMITLFLMIVLGAATAVFMGSASVTEAESFALVFGAGGLRFLAVMGVVLFCCFYMRRLFETKEVEFLLSRPISRMTFLLSHGLSFALLSAMIAAVVTLALSFLGKPDMVGLAVWGGSLVAELAIISIAALFFSMVVSSAAGSALATLGLYALARMIGTLLGIIALPPSGWGSAILGNVMQLISIFVPRLDMMGQTSWLVYGVEGSGGIKFLPEAGSYALTLISHMGLAGFIALQGMVFVALLLAAAAHDFTRRQF